MATPTADNQATKEAIEQAVARGSELLKAGKLEDAQKAFRAALLLDGDNPRVLALLGLAHFRGNQFEQARAIYEDLVERSPTDASHRLNLGLVYLKLGDGAKAINSLEASRALDPSQGRAVSYLGLAYARAGRYAEAYRSFLLAGQTELASEIESNLTTSERDGIHSQLQRSGLDVKPARTSSRDLPIVTRTASPELSAPEAAPPEPVNDAVTAPAAAATSDAVPQPPSTDADAPRLTESLQFVLPTRVGPPPPTDGRSALRVALDQVAPSHAAMVLPRTGAQGSPPIPLSQLATDELIRPDDGEDRFELSSSGALVIRVSGRMFTRLDGVHVTGGDLTFEPALRRSRGHKTEEKFDHGGPQLHVVNGQGYLIAVPQDKQQFTAVVLDDDIFYLREDLVFAFESTLRWENGNVPGLRGRLPVVQFRGNGAVALRSSRPLVRVKLPPSGILFVDAGRLAGWIGRVIPRAVVPPAGSPMGDVCVECTGEGVVLVDPTSPPIIAVEAKKFPDPVAPPERHTPPPPPAAPAPPSPPIDLDLVKTADWLNDDDDEPGRDEI
ncbi:MAG: tetratricopeptide repeat protein [Kofleriaceae bacterium]